VAWRHHALAAALTRKARHGAPGGTEASLLAAGEGWRAFDVVCTCGPRDRPFEERHDAPSVSLVLAGTFACRSRCGSCLLSPGAWFLVSGGEPIECSHQHGEGDRCLSFQFDAEIFACLAHGAAGARVPLARQAVPPLRVHAALAARAMLAAARGEAVEEIAFEVAGAVVQTAVGGSPAEPASRHHAAIARTIRWLSAALDSPHTLAELARAANMSPYHFLRTFKAVTGITPHQWLLRARLREAAQRLAHSRTGVTAIALDVGFDDLSNFIRSFRAEFGVSPRQYRLAAA
jgi:AraC family transcriptional regulator